MPANLGVDMAKVVEYVQGVISRVAENEKVYTEGVTVRFGKVSFKSAAELDLNGEIIGSRKTLIATGSRPVVPSVEGLEETGYLTNEGVFDLMRLPASIIVVGGGPMGVELGQAFERLGARVTLVQGPSRILPKEDPQVSEMVASVLKSEGIDVVTSARFIKASRNGDKKVVTARQGDQLLNFEADEIILAVGRRPNVERLNLAAAGGEKDGKGTKGNERLQTSTTRIMAFGDVSRGHLYTTLLGYPPGVGACNALLAVAKKKVDYRVVAWCTFTDPEAARVGLTPEEAEQRYKQVRIVKFPWAEIDRAQTEGETTGFIKLVLAGKKKRDWGGHMGGGRAGRDMW